MNGKKHLAIWLALIALLLLSLPVLAQSGGAYDLSWSTVDGGGGTSTGGDYRLSGTIGQPDAGTMSGGGYIPGGGFWGGSQANVAYRIYLPLVLRNAP